MSSSVWCKGLEEIHTAVIQDILNNVTENLADWQITHTKERVLFVDYLQCLLRQEKLHDTPLASKATAS